MKLGTLRPVASHPGNHGGVPYQSMKRKIHGIFYALEGGHFSCLYLLEEACAPWAEVEWISVPVLLGACLHQVSHLVCFVHADAIFWLCVSSLIVAIGFSFADKN